MATMTITRLMNAMWGRWQRRREMAQLGAMSDRDLKDIGLSRADVAALAAGRFRRGA